MLPPIYKVPSVVKLLEKESSMAVVLKIGPGRKENGEWLLNKYRVSDLQNENILEI